MHLRSLASSVSDLLLTCLFIRLRNCAHRYADVPQITLVAQVSAWAAGHIVLARLNLAAFQAMVAMPCRHSEEDLHEFMNLCSCSCHAHVHANLFSCSLQYNYHYGGGGLDTTHKEISSWGGGLDTTHNLSSWGRWLVIMGWSDNHVSITSHHCVFITCPHWVGVKLSITSHHVFKFSCERCVQVHF